MAKKNTIPKLKNSLTFYNHHDIFIGAKWSGESVNEYSKLGWKSIKALNEKVLDNHESSNSKA